MANNGPTNVLSWFGGHVSKWIVRKIEKEVSDNANKKRKRRKWVKGMRNEGREGNIHEKKGVAK